MTTWTNSMKRDARQKGAKPKWNDLIRRTVQRLVNGNSVKSKRLYTGYMEYGACACVLVSETKNK